MIRKILILVILSDFLKLMHVLMDKTGMYTSTLHKLYIEVMKICKDSFASSSCP